MPQNSLIDGVKVFDCRDKNYLEQSSLDQILLAKTVQDEVDAAASGANAPSLTSNISAIDCKFMREELGDAKQMLVIWQDPEKPEGQKIQAFAWGLNPKTKELWVVPNANGIPPKDLAGFGMPVESDEAWMNIVRLTPDMEAIAQKVAKNGAPPSYSPREMEVIRQSFIGQSQVSYIINVFDKNGNRVENDEVSWHTRTMQVALQKDWTVVVYANVLEDTKQVLVEKYGGQAGSVIVLSVTKGEGIDKPLKWFHDPIGYDANGRNLKEQEMQKPPAALPPVPVPDNNLSSADVLKEGAVLAQSARYFSQDQSDVAKTATHSIDMHTHIETPSLPIGKLNLPAKDGRG